MNKVPFSSARVHAGSGNARLADGLDLPPHPSGLVLFAHGSAGDGPSAHNNYVAGELRRVRLGTLFLDLVDSDGDCDDGLRIDMGLLAAGLGDAARWLAHQPQARDLALGLFGAGTGADAALQFAAGHPEQIAAVVARSGRPDPAAADELARVRAPTLLIVGGEDHISVELNRRALRHLNCEKELVVIRGATRQFGDPGALAEVARLSARWFKGYLGA